MLVLLIRRADHLLVTDAKPTPYLQFAYKTIFAEEIAVQQLQRRIGDGIRAKEDDVQRLR